MLEPKDCVLNGRLLLGNWWIHDGVEIQTMDSDINYLLQKSGSSKYQRKRIPDMTAFEFCFNSNVYDY